MRRSGVLMPISALPGPYGIGVFGKEAYTFIDRIAEMGFAYWQLLPFTIVDSGNSPYSSVSTFAGNYLYIDPRQLCEMGLLTVEEAEDGVYEGSIYTADYAFARQKRRAVLEKAFSRLTNAQVAEIEQLEQPWLNDFAHFMCLKENNNGLPWYQWKETTTDASRILFWKFVQYMFFQQWQKVKEYGNRKGIQFIGDMPIYPSMDSCDVWASKELFQIDPDTGIPTGVAGVPPDYFAEEGQLWGNPLYDWDQMQNTGYQWWRERLEHAFSMFDKIRIDHFRAFASYWAVPYGAKTAKEGHWEKGPGIQLFTAMPKQYMEKIIAEDLGCFGEDVTELLQKTGFPGMKVIQFGFTPGENSAHLPHNYSQNSVAYVGTHDNNTLLGWLWEATEQERSFALRYCGFSGDDWGEGGYHAASCRSIIEAVWKSTADTAIISVQDMCGFGSDARMNIPGVGKDNWRFRITEENLAQIDCRYFRDINELYCRK